MFFFPFFFPLSDHEIPLTSSGRLYKKGNFDAVLISQQDGNVGLGFSFACLFEIVCPE